MPPNVPVNRLRPAPGDFCPDRAHGIYSEPPSTHWPEWRRRQAGPVSDSEDVVDFKRLIDLGKPLRPVGGAAAAAFIERQFQLTQQAGDFLPGRDVPHARPGAKGPLVEVIEGGQAAREKLAIDHTFGKTVDGAKAHPARQFLKAANE